MPKYIPYVLAILLLMNPTGCNKRNETLCDIAAVNIDDQQNVVVGCRVGNKKVRLYLLEDLILLTQIESEGSADVTQKTLEKLVRERIDK